MSNASTSAELSKQLIEALSQKPVNILRVRSLCRAHPGLIASAGLRLKTWCTLLLGLGSQSSLETDEAYLQQDIADPVEPCGEQHVLEADVHRTRAEIDLFRTPSVREYVRCILQTFCLDHEIEYKQGMNEVLAPFIALVHNPHTHTESESDSQTQTQTQTQTQQHRLTYSLFKAFLFRYLERFFCVDDSSFLFKAFRMFHLLLLYFDPQLASHLNDWNFSPEFYSPQWFLTLYARALPLPHVLRLWDMMIAMDDPSFTFFIGLVMLRRERQRLLLGDENSIPEAIQHISFKSEEEIDGVVREAIQLYQTTPRCLLRQLRLCCVSTTELTPLPALAKMQRTTGSAFSSTLHSMRLNVEEHDELLALQTVRKCVTITAQELVDELLPAHRSAVPASAASSSSSSRHERDRDTTGEKTREGEWDSSMHIPQQFVVIDIRSYEEKTLSGGGGMPRAIELDPDFLNSRDAFDVWVQHFDGTRGCNIVIVDLPPAQWRGLALWRRLLLGEGDASYGDFRTRFDFDNPLENQRRLDALIASKRASGSDVDVRHEEEVVKMEMKRPAVLLAIALQAHAFPNVSVLDGGFPALVEHLLATRGTVEPIVINHEAEKWEKFLRQSGRSVEGLKPAKKQGKQSVKDSAANAQPPPTPKKAKDLSDKEKLLLARGVAERLQHKTMLEIIAKKIESLQTSPPS